MVQRRGWDRLIVLLKVAFSHLGFCFLEGGCGGVEGRVKKGLAGSPHTRGIVFTHQTPPLVWVEPNETGFQSLNRRSRYSTRPSPLNAVASSLKTRFEAPEPLLIWAYLEYPLSLETAAQEAVSAAPRGLDARHRPVDPGSRGALTASLANASGVCLTPS